MNDKQEDFEHLERTVRNLNKQPMDLLLIHNMRYMDNHWPTLKDWKETGRVRKNAGRLTFLTSVAQH